MSAPLHIWVIGDGKAGHENQSLGLADALGRRLTLTTHLIPLQQARGFAGRMRSAFETAGDLPKPALVLAAGHTTHLPLLLLARKYKAPGVVLMKPSLPVSWFDLCIAPSHDFPEVRHHRNIVLTRGALHRVTPGGGERSGKLILIGGPSKTHGWDSAALVDMLRPATDRGGWTLSDSRRTPPEFLELARDRLPGVEVVSHRDTPPGWVPSRLRAAKETWVTEDSVSMIYEALASGTKVGLLPVPRRRGGTRVLRGIDALVADGFVTRYADWEKSGRIAPPPEVLREADRCAEIVIARFLAGRG